MKIIAINSTCINTNQKKLLKNNKISVNNNFAKDYSPVFYKPVFKGKIPLDKLYEEYNWYINCDRIPAIDSFLKMEAPQEVMDQFYTEILKTKDRGYQLIESIVSQPRKTDYFVKKLKEKMGSRTQHLMTFMYNTPYYTAYENYINTKYKNSNTIVELLKIRPDWRGSALLEKYRQLTGNDNLTIGNIPKPIPDSHMYKIVDYLKDKMEFGMKYDKSIDDLIIDGQSYKFKFFTEGKSSKNVFGLFVPSANKKYVIKMEDPQKRSLDEPFALGTLAKIDAYLTANRSRNSAPLYFYDHKNNFSVYKYIEHTPLGSNTNNISTIREHLPDFKSLGLDYNDTVGFNNFFVLNEHSSDTHHKTEGFLEALKNSEWISVDNDHVTYSNTFQPSFPQYHASLPNAMQMFF